MARYPAKLYQPGAREPFKLSRSKIDLFIECPRCFYLDRRLGVARPSIPAFTLNSAVDFLLKKEFDLLRKNGEAHPLQKKYHIEAVPYSHPRIDAWRDNFTGVQHLHEKTNLLVFGAIDDVWADASGRLSVVDYKSTSTEREISLEDQYKQGYKRQMEVYQWLMKRNEFDVSDTGYFVFANAGKNREKFDGRLEFELSIVSYEGSDAWVEPTLVKIKECLDADRLPGHSPDCEYCAYTKSRMEKIAPFAR